MLTLFTDTDCDFNLETAAKYGYKLISMPYSINGKTIYPYEDFEVFEYGPYYDSLRSGVIPTTSAIGEDAYIRYFEPEFASGNDIFYVHFSSAMSASFEFMDKALAFLKQKYPERKFYSVDTKGITIVSYLIATEISDLLKSGRTAEEVMEWSSTHVDRFAQYFFADDLKFFRRSGRVSGLAATMGGLIGLRPIIHMSGEGKMESIGTEKGRAKAMEKLLSYVDELGDDVTAHKIIIGHTDALTLAEDLSSIVREKYGEDADIEFVCTNPTAGAHCGPNGVGIAFHAKHR